MTMLNETEENTIIETPVTALRRYTIEADATTAGIDAANTALSSLSRSMVQRAPKVGGYGSLTFEDLAEQDLWRRTALASFLKALDNQVKLDQHSIL